MPVAYIFSLQWRVFGVSEDKEHHERRKGHPFIEYFHLSVALFKQRRTTTDVHLEEQLNEGVKTQLDLYFVTECVDGYNNERPSQAKD